MNLRRAARHRILATLLLVAAACGGSGDTDDQVATGVVIDVVGDLTTVESFTIRTVDGDDLTFVPVDGVRFHGLGPLGHLRSHLTAGEPVAVEYEETADGTLLAVAVEDG